MTLSVIAQDANPQPAPVADPNAPVLPTPVPPDLDPTIPAQIPAVDTNVTTAPAEEPQKAPPKPKKKPAPRIPTLRGMAGAINTTNMTLTVDVKGKEEVVKITSQTRIFADAKPAILADAKQGEKVLVEYKTGKDKSKEALALRFGSLTPVAKKE
jgi:hypothetical protein